jgi:hypothetical protein
MVKWKSDPTKEKKLPMIGGGEGGGEGGRGQENQPWPFLEL